MQCPGAADHQGVAQPSTHGVAPEWVFAQNEGPGPL